MPKRKRDDLEEKLDNHRTALSRALKVAKGHERQRMAKRSRDPNTALEKKARIETEIEVLKSLDLHSVAHVHICSSLMRIKAVAESPRLPDEIKQGVPKSGLSEEEQAALHNVTSGLFNQKTVQETFGKAIADICRALHVPVPDKKSKLRKGDHESQPVTRRKDTEDQAEIRREKTRLGPTRNLVDIEEKNLQDRSSPDVGTEWNGLSEVDEYVEEVENSIACLDDRLASHKPADLHVSNDEEHYDTANEELDPMEITDVSASEGSGTGRTLAQYAEDEEPGSPEGNVSESGTAESAVSLPPKLSRKESTKVARIKKEGGFLPSLMGGYISGSESEASDIDVAPALRKNRRGQRARQAIWEKKFRGKAKHLSKEKASRDYGWDMKRGAVDGKSERTPWKKGIRTPIVKKLSSRQPDQQNPNAEPVLPRQRPKKEDEGPLHPSWEARRNLKKAQQAATFQGKRTTFD